MAKKKSEDELLKNIKFEDGLARLEEIIALMERGALDLDQSVRIFEEGARLYGALTEKLDGAEGRVKAVLEDFEGKTKLEDLNS